MLLEKIKKLNFEKFFDLFIYFLLIYLSTECLNGNNGDYIKYFGEGATTIQKLALVCSDIKFFVWFPKIIYAGIIYACVYHIFNSIIKKSKVSCIAISSISVIFSIINFIVTQVRGTAISVADIFSVQTALNVSKGLSININGFFVCGIILFIIANFFIWKKDKFWNKDESGNLQSNNLIRLLVSFLTISYLMFVDPYISSLQVWDINLSYKENGSAVTLIRLLKNLKIDEPEDYSGEKVEDILDKYEEEQVTSTNNMPNVLVVMNESFSDLLRIYNIDSSGDNLPYFHSLMNEENVISGNMHSSFIGGRTANVEFEFLTQNSITAFPVGSYPYQQYINETVKESFASYMNDFGYETYAIHSWYTSGYSRKKIYNLMQFENIMFKEDMDELEFLPNGYSTDSSTYKYWYDIMENKPKTEKNFTFLLTVQNHLPYESSEGTQIKFVEDNEELNAYLNFASESDNALKELIEFIKSYDENTVVLFFGDHQPNLNLIDKYGSTELYEDAEAQYIVPFFIWANYDIEEKSGIEISANFMQNLLIDAVGLYENEYDQYTNSIMKEIPVITMQYYIDKAGNRYDINDTSSPYYDLIEEYKSVVYYQMFEESVN